MQQTKIPSQRQKHTLHKKRNISLFKINNAKNVLQKDLQNPNSATEQRANVKHITLGKNSSNINYRNRVSTVMLLILTVLIITTCCTLGACTHSQDIDSSENDTSGNLTPETSGSNDSSSNNGSNGDNNNSNNGIIENVPETPSKTHLVQTTAAVNLRLQPNSTSQVIATAEKYSILTYISQENSWYKVKYNNQTLYLSTSYSRLIKINGSETVIEKIITVGKSKMGYPYVYGAARLLNYNLDLNGAFTGRSFDCSSFVQYVYYMGAGIKLQGDTRSQYRQKLGKSVNFSALQRGDVMFFTNAQREHLSGVERIGHVAIYLGDNMIMHTYSPQVGSLIEPLSTLRKSRFISAKRYV